MFSTDFSLPEVEIVRSLEKMTRRAICEIFLKTRKHFPRTSFRNDKNSGAISSCCRCKIQFETLWALVAGVGEICGSYDQREDDSRNPDGQSREVDARLLNIHGLLSI